MGLFRMLEGSRNSEDVDRKAGYWRELIRSRWLFVYHRTTQQRFNFVFKDASF